MDALKKPFVALTIAAIVLIALASVGPIAYKALTSPGIRTDGINASNAGVATVGLDGHWKVTAGRGRNATGVGFTFDEVLPGQRKSTSGTTRDVTGFADISDKQLIAGEIIADATTIKTDVEKRDVNVRKGILHTTDYPTASFIVRDRVDLSSIPDDGSIGSITVPGVLTLHGTSHEVNPTLDVLRSGESIIIAGAITVNRLDYNIETPEFVAATIAEEGEINIRITLEK